MDTVADSAPTSRRSSREGGIRAWRYALFVLGVALLLSAFAATGAHASTADAPVGAAATGAVLAQATPATVDSASATGSLAAFMTNPLVAALVMTVALWLLTADLASGGIGLPSALAALGFAAFFWAHVQAGSAGGGEVALVVVGLALIVLELLVIPGFGLAGLAGLAAVLGGLFMAQVGDSATPAQVQAAALTVGATLVAVLVGLVVMVRFLIRFGAPNALVLDAQLGSGEPINERATGGWVRWFGGDDLVLSGSSRDGRAGDLDEDPPFLGGKRGITRSPLRPSGIAEIDGERIDVITSGEFIPAGEQIEVIDDTHYRRVVRRVPDPQDQRSQEGSS